MRRSWVVLSIPAACSNGESSGDRWSREVDVQGLPPCASLADGYGYRRQVMP